jgi:sigma-B regulation protein RsbU (phosphoserine phosphatase)
LSSPEPQEGPGHSSDAATPPAPENGDKVVPADVIAVRAYEKWVRKGRPQGTTLQDWLEAEAELAQFRDLAHSLREANASLSEALAESRRREEALRQAEERYRAIFDNAIEGIFQTTPDGRFIAANPALARMLGFASPADLVAGVRDVAEQLHVSPERRAEFQRLLREDGQVHGFECQVYRKDRTILWISLTARAVRGPSGALDYYEGTVEDITQRKHAEDALKNSEALYRSLVNALPLCIFRKDLHGRFTFGNDAFCASVKRSLPELVGKNDLDIYPSDLAYKYIHDDRQVIETGEVLEAIEEHQKVDAERTYVQVLKAPLFDGRGDVIGMQAIFWDITARKWAEGELARTAAEFRVARTIQQKLFPREVPQVAGMDIGAVTFAFDIGGASYPAEAIGGDYYDFLLLPDGSLGIAIGDVSGHGVGPALLMAEARALLRAFAQMHSDVSTILKLVNRVLTADIEGDRFITLLLAKLVPRTRTLVYASAGHQTAYLLNAAGSVKQALPSTSIPLGIMAEMDFPASPEVRLEPGDIAFLATDGIVEARSPEGLAFGLRRPLDLIRVYRWATARQIVDNLYYAVRAFSQNEPQCDDITVAILKVNAEPPAQARAPASPPSPPSPPPR